MGWLGDRKFQIISAPVSWKLNTFGLMNPPWMPAATQSRSCFWPFETGSGPPAATPLGGISWAPEAGPGPQAVNWVIKKARATTSPAR